jgi:general secretion pathway protein J
MPRFRCSTARLSLYRPLRCQTGFTLLELLVAILILGLIMTAAFGALRLGSRSWESGVLRANEAQELRAVTDFLRRQFNQLAPISWSKNKNKMIAFYGDSQRVRFIATAPEYSGGPGLLLYSLTADRQEFPESLVLSYSPFDPGTGRFENSLNTRSVVLIDENADVSFAFFGAKSAKGKPDWHQEWPSDAEQFPSVIRMRSVTDGGSRHWPDLMVTVFSDQAQ